MILRILLLAALLLAFTACTTADPALVEAPVQPTAQPTERPTLPRLPTSTPRLIATPTATPAPSATPVPPSLTLRVPTAVLLSDDAPASSVIGYSLGARPLVAQRFGSASALTSRVLLLVGGIHGGWEGNTVTLMEALIDHFTKLPEDVPPGVALMIIPVANPDGYALGRVEQGRFNNAGVDLNRNWSCEWSAEAYWRRERVNPGARPFSEPETRALADFIGQTRPAGVLFFHSAANGVFAGDCGGDHGSEALAATFGEAAGYLHDAPFTAYPVTGVASNWADGEGIPAADVELRSSSDSEYEQNLRGVLAILAEL
ncbi:MAG: M14 family zinc carboxypeptidase [Chloroflexota bacterium]